MVHQEHVKQLGETPSKLPGIVFSGLRPLKNPLSADPQGYVDLQLAFGPKGSVRLMEQQLLARSREANHNAGEMESLLLRVERAAMNLGPGPPLLNASPRGLPPMPPRMGGATPTATVGVDISGSGRPDTLVTGVDRNRDGIPDALQQLHQSGPTSWARPPMPPPQPTNFMPGRTGPHNGNLERGTDLRAGFSSNSITDPVASHPRPASGWPRGTVQTSTAPLAASLHHWLSALLTALLKGSHQPHAGVLSD